jgi:DNA/RNA endonuclease G (NUC1)
VIVTLPGPPRDGFDPGFLGVRTPLPSLPGVPTVVLDYTHFSTLHRPDRRLAAATAVGIDGAAITAGDEPTGTVRRQLTSYTDIVI